MLFCERFPRRQTLSDTFTKVTGRTESTLDQAVADLQSTSSTASSVTAIPGDVTQEGDVFHLFQTIQQEFGRCDVLVNNAGAARGGPPADLTLQDFQYVLNVNVTGPFLCARHALKMMNEGGRIINIGSLSAKSPRPHSLPYTTSKFALLGMTQALALDARQQGVAVSIIHPGNVRTNLLSEEEAALRDKTEGFIQPEDVADCVAQMCRMPLTANVLEMTVLPTRQPFQGRG